MPGTCRNCRFLDVKPDADGRRIPRGDRSYPCRWNPPAIPMARSLTRFSVDPIARLAIMERTRMGPDDGEGCPVREPIEGKK